MFCGFDMEEGRVQVTVTGGVGCFVITRKDGQELSFTSMGNGLVQFDGGKQVKDFGPVFGFEQFMEAVATFMQKPVDENEE